MSRAKRQLDEQFEYGEEIEAGAASVPQEPEPDERESNAGSDSD